MQIIIELSDETYKDIKEENGIYGINNGLSARMTGKVVGAIQNGKPLPKGHGRLIDADKEIAGLKEMKVVDEKDKQSVRFAILELEYTKPIIEADKEQEDTYKYLLNGAESLVKEHSDLVRGIWNCSSCEHTEDECKDCYPELGYKNDKARRDTEAVKEFVEGDTFEKLMKSLDEQDRADREDTEQFLRDIKEQEE